MPSPVLYIFQNNDSYVRVVDRSYHVPETIRARESLVEYYSPVQLEKAVDLYYKEKSPGALYLSVETIKQDFTVPLRLFLDVYWSAHPEEKPELWELEDEFVPQSIYLEEQIYNWGGEVY